MMITRQTLSLPQVFSQTIDQLKALNRHGTAGNYQAVLRSINQYVASGIRKRRLTIRSIDAAFVENYNQWLMGKGLTRNSISFHNRILRAIIMRAIGNDGFVGGNPFRNVYTGVAPTCKRAVDIGVIARIVSLELQRDSPLQLARDLFLFSFYARGMAFVDMAFLQRTDIVDHRISYMRRKTGQRLTLHVEPCMRHIIDRYSNNDTPYLFPLIKTTDVAKAYTQYRTALAYNNRLLKKISKLIGYDGTLSFYVARHTWATVARKKSIPLSVISAAMGHTSEKTTQIYLDSIENDDVDQANSRVLAAVSDVLSVQERTLLQMQI